MSEKELTESARDAKLNRTLQHIHSIPSYPEIIHEVSKLVSDPMASASRLGEIVNRDQSLVAKILSVANSPFYGIVRRVSTVQFAIMILGFEQVRDIVIGISLLDSFNKVVSPYFNQKKYWQHSLMTATTAKKLCEDLGLQNSGEAFTAGLLHDLGIPIIGKYFPKEFGQINEAVAQGSTFLEAEASVLGIGHQEVAGVLMEKWNLPFALIEAVKYHHYPVQAVDSRELASIIHLADYMTTVLQTGDFIWDKDYNFDKDTITVLKLGDEEYLSGFIESYREMFRNQLQALSHQ